MSEKVFNIKQKSIQNWYGRDGDGVPLRGDALLDFVRRERGNRILLSFSRGKDSLAMWLYLREKGFEIIPYYLFMVPDMPTVEESLRYYEDVFETHIIRLPHPLFYQYLHNFLYQTPRRVAIIRRYGLPLFDFADIDNILVKTMKLEPAPFAAVGMRYYDNTYRRWLIEQQSCLGKKRRRYFYAIWDWTVEDVAGIIKKHGVKLPRDYALFGKTMTAFDYRYLKPIQENWPQDWEQIKFWFPLIDAELFRIERVGQ